MNLLISTCWHNRETIVTPQMFFREATDPEACLELDRTVRISLSHHIVYDLESEPEFPGDGHASRPRIVPLQDGDLRLFRDRCTAAVLLLVPADVLAGGALEGVAADRNPVVSAH